MGDLPNDAVAQGSIGDSSALKEESEPPPMVVLSGRVGKGSEVNGRYELSNQQLNGRPVYDHEIEQLRLFHVNGHWAVGPRNFESTKNPANLVRCRSDASHPLRISAFWEVLDREDDKGHMVTLETRVYSTDRFIRVTDPDSVPAKPSEVSNVASRPLAEIGQSDSCKGGYPVSKAVQDDNALVNATSIHEEGDVSSRTASTE